MSITASTLYRDTMNFTRNQLPSIVLLALLSAFITVILGHVFAPDSEQLSLLNADSLASTSSQEPQGLRAMIESMTPEQQGVLIRASSASFFSALFGNALLTSGILMLIQMVSRGQPTSALRAVGAAAPLLPRLLLLIFICTLVVQLGTILLLIPGILLAITVSLAPVIAVADNSGVFLSLKTSGKLVWANVRLVAPAVIFWLLAKVVILVLAMRLSMSSPTVMGIVINAISNLASVILLIYLFRLYMLLRK
ncbi:UPF0259 family protein [Affinibrenneria salicis]|uniref:UPF0259 membrane protein FJU30_05950 n=1 Tax=Affinibrenneria salicis TaxID=2590031 RepID=A0A5J5G462_9GAMM|nr:YciC family protein [Affinibrenneria salicis]KAA9001829.1 UPF0259 family protein [Affinibrenneria salicis]